MLSHRHGAGLHNSAWGSLLIYQDKQNQMWDESMCSPASGTPPLLLGRCETKNMDATGPRLFSSYTTSVRICPKAAWFWQFPLLSTHFAGISISFPNQNLQGQNSRKEWELQPSQISTRDEEAKCRVNAVCYNPRLPHTRKSSRIQAVIRSA